MRSILSADAPRQGAPRRDRTPARRPVAMMAVVLPVLFGFGVAAHAEMTERQIIVKIERDFGVEVLKVGPAKNIGPQVMAVTVMSPPGDFNEAYQVNTLAVDARTGKLVRLDIPTGRGDGQSAPPVTVRTKPRVAETP